MDAGTWTAGLLKFLGSSYEAFGTISLQGSFSSPVATTVDLVCAGLGAEEQSAFLTKLSAVEVTRLG